MLTCIEAEEPTAKRICREFIPQWTSLPSEIFMEIFENSCTSFGGAQAILPEIGLVCKAWTECSIQLKLKLANVHGLSMFFLFGHNQFGICKFIENHQHVLLQLNLPHSSSFSSHLTRLQLTQLKTLEMGDWASEIWPWIVNLPKLSTLQLHSEACPDESLNPESRAQILADVVRMSSLTALNIGNMNEFISSNLHRLTSLTALKSFSFTLKFGNEELKTLSLFTRLTQLRLHPHIGAEDPSSLSMLTDLKILNLRNWKNHWSLTFTEQLTKLKDLSIQYQTKGSLPKDGELASFSSMRNLQQLELWSWNLSGEGFQYLHPLTRLERLTTHNCSKFSIEFLVNLTSLKQLDCSSIRDEDLLQLSSLTNLNRLNTERVGKHADWQFLKQLTSLELLSIYHSQLSVDAFNAMGSAASLKCLFIDSCKLESTSFSKLNNLNHLEWLRVSASRFLGAAFFCQPFLTRLHTLSLTDTAIEIVDSQLFSSMTNLTDLDLSRVRGINGGTIPQLAKLTSLRELELEWSLFSFEKLTQLIALKKLKRLKLTVSEHWKNPLKAIFKANGTHVTYTPGKPGYMGPNGVLVQYETFPHFRPLPDWLNSIDLDK